MERSERERIDAAWSACRSWITEFDGACNETVFPGIRPEVLRKVLEDAGASIRQPCWSDDYQGPETFDGWTASKAIERLTGRELVNCFAIWTERLPSGFELRVSLMIEPDEAGRIDVTAIWWSDEVFPVPHDTDASAARFVEVLAFFIRLGDSLLAERIFLSPEDASPPGERRFLHEF